ncbi:uncharacterized protein LOC123922302 [Trifolium pratense]|uniref:uncharacterized protein LOC123922302 n=1 Tax=Trifolium pratense TaxID=57577 RepID=UPI001E6932C4|nr:uncharacterized protein LOC123922302 [Trifolium pratense]
MEASLTSTNVHVNNHIPDDIIFSILSKLPLKSFKQFECVHKSWSLLFDDTYFITMYHNNLLSNDCSYYDDTCLLVGVTEGTEYYRMGGVLVGDMYSLSGENFENSVKLDWPNPPFPEDEDLDLDGDGDEYYIGFGKVCVLSTISIGNLYYGIHATNEFKVIPSSLDESGAFLMLGFAIPRYHLVGYDHIKDDYKVIRFMDCDGDDDDDYGDDDDDDYDDKIVSFWEIYSLNSNLWRKIDVDMPLYSTKKNVYIMECLIGGIEMKHIHI